MPTHLQSAKAAADFVRQWLDNHNLDPDEPGYESAKEQMLKEVERLALGKPAGRVLKEKSITEFVKALNNDDPDWAKSDIKAVLRSANPKETIRERQRIAMMEVLCGPSSVIINGVECSDVESLRAAPISLSDVKAAQLERSKESERRLLALAVLPNILADLSQQNKIVRECACGCGKWFLAERLNQRHYADHRKLAWQQGMTAEQKERRRVQNQQAQRRYYGRDLKAGPK